MTRPKTLVINVAINSLLFYAVGRWVRGHRSGVALGIVGGIVSGISVSRIDQEAEAVPE